MQKPNKGRKVALVAGLALVVLSVAMVWTYWKELESWYAFWRDFESIGKNAQRYPEYRHRQTGIVFVGLPGGTFDMGRPKTMRRYRNVEGPVHKVTLSPFLIAKYEVNQAEWKKVMGVDSSRFESKYHGPKPPPGDTLPVDALSWEGCQEFCKKTGLSLPTEAQWEYACRAGKSGPFAGTGNLDDMAWYEKNSGKTTHPVGEKQPNDFGLHDMHGNVWEVCEDWYQEDFYQESTGARDPLCENSGSKRRVIRGGNQIIPAWGCRSAFRGGVPPSVRAGGVGLRPAWSSP